MSVKRAIEIMAAAAQAGPNPLDRIDMIQAARAVLDGSPSPEPGMMIVNRYQWHALGGIDADFDALPTVDFGDGPDARSRMVSGDA